MSNHREVLRLLEDAVGANQSRNEDQPEDHGQRPMELTRRGDATRDARRSAERHGDGRMEAEWITDSQWEMCGRQSLTTT